MKREIYREIEIPEGVEVKIDGDIIKVKGEKGEDNKRLNLREIELEIKENKITIGNKSASKNTKRMINTTAAHIRNMIKGVTEGYEYILKVASSHFPITVELQDNKAIVKNFLGEKIPREVKIIEGVNVKIDGDIITVSSNSKEFAGQTAANFEKSTRIKMRDRRIFQDGIFITNKGGKAI